MTDPYLDELKAQAKAEACSRLRTLKITQAATLERVPAIATEIETLLQTDEMLAWAEIVPPIEKALATVADVLWQFDDLPVSRQPAEFEQRLARVTSLTAGRLSDSLSQAQHAQQQAEKNHALQQALDAEKQASANANLTAERLHTQLAEAKQQVAQSERLRQTLEEQWQAARLAAADTEALSAQLAHVQAKLEALQSPTWVPKMVAIPGGSFEMGMKAGRDEGGYDLSKNAIPVHRQTIEPFLMSQTPVTFAQYDHYCSEAGLKKPSDEGWGRAQRPVINVSHSEALEYCAWLRQSTGRRFRLPTEAEWEYAARGGLEAAYPWGDSPPSSRDACFDQKRTQPVASYPANGYGLYDMAGNVWEWVQDRWRDDYDSDEVSDRLVLRGGAFNYSANKLRCAARFWCIRQRFQLRRLSSCRGP